MKKLWLMIGGLTVALVAVIAMRIYMNDLVDHLDKSPANPSVNRSTSVGTDKGESGPSYDELDRSASASETGDPKPVDSSVVDSNEEQRDGVEVSMPATQER